MTGYGCGSFLSEKGEISVEIRTVNNRYLDLSLKLPKSFSVYEQRIREQVGQYLSRGRVNIWMQLKGEEDEQQTFSVNHTLVQAYLEAAREINQKHKLSGELDLQQILMLPDVLSVDVGQEPDEAEWERVRNALETALQETAKMRAREGQEIRKDFDKRLAQLDEYVSDIQQLADRGPDAEMSKLRDRVKRLITHEEIDEYRLELELALISDRIDISEECTRFFSHLTLFRELLEDEQSQGRKINFLLQEMNREANTMASKAYTADISHRVVKMKEEIEKIREQVQNIE